jgi:hypothetical protein
MSDAKIARQRISNGSVDGAVLTTKFFCATPVERVLNTQSLSADVRDMLAAYGLNAAAKAAYHGTAETPEQAIEIYDRFVEKLRDGQWEPGLRPPGISRPSELVEALMRHTGHPQEHIEEILNGLEPAAKRQLYGDPDFAPVLAKVKKERADEAAKAAKASGKPKGSVAFIFAPKAAAAE